MTKEILLDKNFIRESTSRAKVSGRSVVQQIEYDAKIGRIAIDNPDLSYAFIEKALLAKDEMERGEIAPYVRKSSKTPKLSDE
ncbi:TA system antitoxin ParD family protein [Zhongshania aliphaticivorans]|uniref:Uncharacterized protein n=1 Tax=Zhongshania aliphaticivorans TaxID=1470434 RepID=A0A127M213_9GAMM|nr:hypothetical protein [Zhongshania aliphaticivorans]AMO67250.1 hypothetical protein AZF00_02570 [Zhongshania aliphaticivorans]